MALSESTARFLAIKTPGDLAIWLGFPKYSAMAGLIFPTPKYTEFTLKKKNGSDRLIQVPAKKLKDIQRKLVQALNELDNSRPSVHGFRKNKSVVSNAEQHSGRKKQYVFNLDLKDFFPSITFPRVHGIFQVAPFNFPANVATVLARVCTYNGVLPQGAPTSPPLSNYICRGLDGVLQVLAKESFATYTRYADDLTFSFSHKKRNQLSSKIVDTGSLIATVSSSLREEIEKHGFSINTDKVRLRSRHARLEVTGLTVNEFPNVPRWYVDEIRGMLHAWKKYGLSKAQEEFEKKGYKRQLRSATIPPFQNVLRGKLLYLRMVKKSSDKVYNTLARRFNECIKLTPGCTSTQLPVTNLALSEKDLEKAVFVIASRDDPYSFEIKGTCFFLKDVGIVTCEHVLRYPKNTEDDGSVVHNYPDHYVGDYLGLSHGSIFLQDTLENDLCELEIVWLNKNADVAVVRPKAPISIEYLHLDRTTDELTSKDVHLVGFPFHNPGKSLSFAEGKIRSRYKHFMFEHYDITPLIRQGNSGGPVLTPTFHVVGVAKEGEKQDMGNNAVLALKELLQLHSHYSGLHGPLPTGKTW